MSTYPRPEPRNPVRRLGALPLLRHLQRPHEVFLELRMGTRAPRAGAGGMRDSEPLLPTEHLSASSLGPPRPPPNFRLVEGRGGSHILSVLPGKLRLSTSPASWGSGMT